MGAGLKDGKGWTGKTNERLFYLSMIGERISGAKPRLRKSNTKLITYRAGGNLSFLPLLPAPLPKKVLQHKVCMKPNTHGCKGSLDSLD